MNQESRAAQNVTAEGPMDDRKAFTLVTIDYYHGKADRTIDEGFKSSIACERELSPNALGIE